MKKLVFLLVALVVLSFASMTAFADEPPPIDLGFPAYVLDLPSNGDLPLGLSGVDNEPFPPSSLDVFASINYNLSLLVQYIIPFAVACFIVYYSFRWFERIFFPCS